MGATEPAPDEPRSAPSENGGCAVVSRVLTVQAWSVLTMKLVPNPATRGNAERVYAYSIASSAAWLGLWGALGLIGLWIGWHGGVRFPGGGIPRMVGYVCGVSLGLLAAFQSLDFRARLRPTNWLVQIHRDGLLVHLRSFRNFHFADTGPTALFIPYADIESARATIVVGTVPGSERHERTDRKRRTVVLELAPDAKGRDDLARTLDAERKPRQGWTVRHYPVRLAGEDRLEIDWEVGLPMEDFLAAIGSRVKVLAEDASAVDFRRIGGLDPDRQREQLAQLVARGDKLSAVTLARKIYGFDLTRAMNFIDELERRKVR